MIPTDWQKINLSGLARKPIGYGIVQTGPEIEGGIPCLRVVDVAKSPIDISSMIHTSEDIHQSYKRTILQKDDIVLALRGIIGYSIIIPDYLVGTNITRGLALISANPKMALPSFLLQMLMSVSVSTNLLKCTNGSALREIPICELRKVEIPLPPLAEQKKIAEILGCWDLGIQKLDALITAKKKLKKALSQQLLTGKKRFKEFEGQEWKEVRLGNIFKQRNESGCDHLPLLAITGADGIADRDGMERRDTSSADKSKYLRICPDDLGYNTMRMWQGVNGISKLEGIISPAYTVCIPDKKRVFPQFIGYLFKSHPVIFLFYRHSQGLVSDTWNLKFSHFSKINVTIPSIEEQKKIATVLNAADKEIEILSKNLEALKNQKKGLMQKLLTGQIRVR